MAEIVELDGDRPSRPLPVVALIAHDAKKGELLRLIRGNRGLFEGFRLLATRTTGLLIRNELELPIRAHGQRADGRRPPDRRKDRG
jgi:hypothetical protein